MKPPPRAKIKLFPNMLDSQLQALAASAQQRIDAASSPDALEVLGANVS